MEIVMLLRVSLSENAFNISVFKKKRTTAKNGMKTFFSVESMFVCFWQELFWDEQAIAQGLTFNL